jgi:hypothetical protein
MIERYALHDKQGRVTAYVMRETSHRPATFSQAPRSPRTESPTVEAICRLTGLLIVAAMGLIVWLLVSGA